MNAGSWAGPFRVGDCDVFNEHPEPHDGVAVFSADGQPFCLIADDLCVGGRDGAKARATLIAEALNGAHLGNVKRLVEAGREMQRWRGGAGKDSRFDHERQLDDALEPFDVKEATP